MEQNYMYKSAEIIETTSGRCYFGKKGLYPAYSGEANNIGCDTKGSRINTIHVDQINDINTKEILTINDTIPHDKVDENVKVKFENIQDFPRCHPADTKLGEAYQSD